MGTVQPGVVVLVRFPCSDLSSSKLRPAVVLSHADVDWKAAPRAAAILPDRAAVWAAAALEA